MITQTDTFDHALTLCTDLLQDASYVWKHERVPFGFWRRCTIRSLRCCNGPVEERSVLSIASFESSRNKSRRLPFQRNKRSAVVVKEQQTLDTEVVRA